MKCVPQCISVQGYINRREWVMGTKIIWLTIYLTILFKQFPGQILFPSGFILMGAKCFNISYRELRDAQHLQQWSLWQDFKTLLINKVMTSLRHISLHFLSLPGKPSNPSLSGKGKKQSMGLTLFQTATGERPKIIFSYPPPLRELKAGIFFIQCEGSAQQIKHSHWQEAWTAILNL